MNTSSTTQTLYRTIWRWHFYAGLFCIPFVVSLAVTGSIYLFKPQIDAWVEKPYRDLHVLGTRSTTQQQIEVATANLPGSRFVSYRLPAKANDAVVISVSRDSERFLIYLHPYTLEVLKQVSEDKQFIHLVRSFHGELLLGNVGSVLVELAGCWAIVMIITGVYLWWPRSASSLAGVLYPRLRKGKRTFLRDLHAVTGFWVAFFTLFLLISGLPWALVWGTAFKEIRSFNKPAVQQSWNVSAEHAEHSPQNSELEMPLVFPSDELIVRAQELDLAPPVELSPARGNPHEWQLSSQHQNRMLRVDAWFDVHSEELLRTSHFSGKNTIDKVVGIGISAHEGHLFGWFNQLLGLITTSGLILVSVSGFILWRKRKPDGVLGAPPTMGDARIGMVVATITVVLALFLPLLLASLLLVIFLEYAVFRRIPAVRSWLGLKAV